MIVAVDGTAASGKGTLVAKLAKYFNLASLDTGLLYRSVAFSMIKAGDNLKDQEIQSFEESMDKRGDKGTPLYWYKLAAEQGHIEAQY